ncbi:MAG TPA: hypothetical protein IGS17_04260 [Oscillatoriales cyanobacterium M59_W2019_021]|nr:hypothetical protein [Oscillatoriales cyanobacterium M4454_W2019_049]HIK50130.1 hypothetical protein [Oscillatoriales cyanobacterium M59_W2019_021]
MTDDRALDNGRSSTELFIPMEDALQPDGNGRKVRFSVLDRRAIPRSPSAITQI